MKAEQTGRVTSLGGYNAIRIYGRLRHFSQQQFTYVYGLVKQLYESHAIATVSQGETPDLENALSDSAPWGTKYWRPDGPKLLLDKQWDGTPIPLRRLAEAKARGERTGLNLLVATVETTATMTFEPYNR